MEKQKCVGIELRNLSNLIKRNFSNSTNMCEFQSITGIHGWAIVYFYENKDKDIFQRDFELEFSIRRSTATKILQLMEKKELIVREVVNYDARMKKISLTPKSIRIYKIISEYVEKTEEKLKTGLTKKELDIFFSVIEKMKKNIK